MKNGFCLFKVSGFKLGLTAKFAKNYAKHAKVFIDVDWLAKTRSR